MEIRNVDYKMVHVKNQNATWWWQMTAMTGTKIYETQIEAKDLKNWYRLKAELILHGHNLTDMADDTTNLSTMQTGSTSLTGKRICLRLCYRWRILEQMKT